MVPRLGHEWPGLNGTYVGSTPLSAGATYNGTGNNSATYRLGGGTGTLYVGLYPGDAASAQIS